MNKKLFIDSDIILDVLTKRDEFYESAAVLFDLGYEKKTEFVYNSRCTGKCFLSFAKKVWDRKIKRTVEKTTAHNEGIANKREDS